MISRLYIVPELALRGAVPPCVCRRKVFRYKPGMAVGVPGG